MTTLRMTNVMTKMSDNNVTLYFFLLIPERFTHIISHILDCTVMCMCVPVCVWGGHNIPCIVQKD